MKDTLAYFKLSNTLDSHKPEDFPYRATIRLITNFTDEPLQKILAGTCLDQKIYPVIEAAPYKQYHFTIKQTPSNGSTANITFIILDVHNYIRGAFHAASEHFNETLEDIKKFCNGQSAPVVMASFPLPYQSTYGGMIEENTFYKEVAEANAKLAAIASDISNLHILDMNRLLHSFGEVHARDMRSLYSADIPFTNDFFVTLAHECLDYIYACLGRTKKCLVLDLDNTLWGGVVGEVGAFGIQLGPDYPGLAYQNFQRALLELYNRGIILAINSRNNPADVEEVFNTNPHMMLKPEHFAAVRINWNDKAQNIEELARELNIGTDAMVFIDDDAMNRDLVKTAFPDVDVPEWSIPPYEYVPALFGVHGLYQFTLTAEDAKKGRMYAEERQRRAIRTSAADMHEYIALLGITLVVHINDPALVARASQMSLKTNQYNLTTKRYSEKELERLIAKGALIFTADVSDKFGEYGTTLLAIVVPDSSGTTAHLDSFLMSCRVMGRGAEHSFIDFIIQTLTQKGIQTLTAEFIPTTKNTPAKEFLPSLGGVEENATHRITLGEYAAHPPEALTRSIAVGMAV